MDLSDRIKEVRNKCNMSQEALANKLHVSRQAVSKWERGENYPDLDKLLEFSDIFGITLDELVRGDKKLEKRLIDNGGNLMKGRSIFGYVLIVLGILTGFWGGSMYPVSMADPDFMTFLAGASLLVTLGVLLIRELPKWIILGVLYLTLLLSVIFILSLKMELLVTLMGIVVLLGLVWWLTTLILRK